MRKCTCENEGKHFSGNRLLLWFTKPVRPFLGQHLGKFFSVCREHKIVCLNFFFSLELQSLDQRLFREEAAVESVVSSVVKRLVGAVERNVYGEQRNQKHPDESFPVKTLRRGQNKRRQFFCIIQGRC